MMGGSCKMREVADKLETGETKVGTNAAAMRRGVRDEGTSCQLGWPGRRRQGEYYVE